MDATTSSSTMSSQPVFLTTHTQYSLPTQKYMIPTTWKRYQLSQLVNKALSLDKPVPFDFLVRGEILRTSISEWCVENEVGEVYLFIYLFFESILKKKKNFCIGRNSSDRVHRVDYATSKNVRFPTRRLGIVYLLPIKKVCFFRIDTQKKLYILTELVCIVTF